MSRLVIKAGAIDRGSTVYILISSTMIPRYIVVKTHILIELINDNPFHDDTTTDEKYQFTCMIAFRRVFQRWSKRGKDQFP
jgi:hypothetical protein